MRSIFITWLRDQTACPEILKAAAHAQKRKWKERAEKGEDLAKPRLEPVNLGDSFGERPSRGVEA